MAVPIRRLPLLSNRQFGLSLGSGFQSRYCRCEPLPVRFFSPLVVCICASVVLFSSPSMGLGDEPVKTPTPVRFATFNAAMNRRQASQLANELRDGNSRQAKNIAEIIQRVRPEVLLVNEIDLSPDATTAEVFLEHYLRVGQNGQRPMDYGYFFATDVNTGVDAGFDLDGNHQHGGPNDCFGFGYFPGQYGMAVYSTYPIAEKDVRTFQKFLWKDMPGGLLPRRPDNGEHWYPEASRAKFRLSSKNHWDVPIRVRDRVLHFLVCHPTPPVFDGPEDRNGCRNHDEIRLWADYVAPMANATSDYLYDDHGQKGGLHEEDSFVIAGDLNADPADGGSRDKAINQLLEHPRINARQIPTSEGGVVASQEQGKKNVQHRGNPAHDTGDFDDGTVGNLRIDYVLPSADLSVQGAGVYWPKPGSAGADLVTASDHRLVWVDISW